MITYLKGLVSKKVIKKYIFIFSLLLLSFISIYTIYSVLESKQKIENEKEEYRTIYFKSRELEFDDLKDYYLVIEEYQIVHDEKENSYIIFKTVKDKERFIEEYKTDFLEIVNHLSSSKVLSNTMIFILKGVIVFLEIGIFILMTLFYLNYISSISDIILLYNIFGFSKNKIIFNILFFLMCLYLLILILLFIILRLFELLVLTLFYKLILLIILAFIFSYIIIILKVKFN